MNDIDSQQLGGLPNWVGGRKLILLFCIHGEVLELLVGR